MTKIKTLSGISIAALLTLYALSTYRLSHVETALLATADQHNLQVNWVKKSAYRNQLLAEISHKGTNFRIQFNPTLTTNGTYFSLSENASMFISDNTIALFDDKLSLRFSELSGYLSFDPQKQHTLAFQNMVLDSDVGTLSSQEANIVYSFDNQLQPTLMRISLDQTTQSHLGLQAKQITLDLSESTPEDNVLDFTLTDLTLSNTDAFHAFCQPAEGAPKAILCHKELAQSFLPFSLHAKGSIPNAIFNQNHQDAKGYLQVLGNTEFLSLEQETHMAQSFEQLIVNSQQSIRITNTDKYQAFAKLLQTLYPEQTIDIHLEEDNITLRFESTPTSASINLGHDSASPNTPRSSYLRAEFPVDKPYYIKLNGIFYPPLPQNMNPENLTLIGQGSLHHPHYIQMLGEELNQSLSDDIYTIEIYAY